MWTAITAVAIFIVGVAAGVAFTIKLVKVAAMVEGAIDQAANSAPSWWW